MVARRRIRPFLPVEVLRSADGNEGVRVCEGREDTNPERSISILAARVFSFRCSLVGVFELGADSHDVVLVTAV